MHNQLLSNLTSYITGNGFSVVQKMLVNYDNSRLWLCGAFKTVGGQAVPQNGDVQVVGVNLSPMAGDNSVYQRKFQIASIDVSPSANLPITSGFFGNTTNFACSNLYLAAGNMLFAYKNNLPLLSYNPATTNWDLQSYQNQTVLDFKLDEMGRAWAVSQGPLSGAPIAGQVTWSRFDPVGKAWAAMK
jgi:hypothetical protein